MSKLMAIILIWIIERDPEVARLLNLMWKAGLRVTEAAYLRAQDIDLENHSIHLNEEGNTNRTKGGRPRVVEVQVEDSDFFASLKNSPGDELTGHLFTNRRGLPDRARQKVRQACTVLNIPCLGTHAFRKAFSVENYHRARSNGADDRQALLITSHQLGHNRMDVTRHELCPKGRTGERSLIWILSVHTKPLIMDGQYLAYGNFDRIKWSLFDLAKWQMFICSVKTHPQLSGRVGEFDLLCLDELFWGECFEVEIIGLDGFQTLVRFYIPGEIELSEIEVHQHALRNRLTRSYRSLVFREPGVDQKNL